MSKTYSTIEPAKRPYTVALSSAEIIALVKFHGSCAKNLSNATGKFLTQGGGGMFKLPSSTEARIAIKVAKESIEAHGNRARGLLSFIQK